MKLLIVTALTAITLFASCKQRSYSDESGVTEASAEKCEPSTMSIRVGTDDFDQVERNCDQENNSYYVFSRLSGSNSANVLFEVSSRDFPDHREFLNKKFARWGIIGTKAQEHRFLKSDVLPLYSKGDEISKKKAQQIFVDFLVKTYGG
jgi:hypothetical protein